MDFAVFKDSVEKKVNLIKQRYKRGLLKEENAIAELRGIPTAAEAALGKGFLLEDPETPGQLYIPDAWFETLPKEADTFGKHGILANPFRLIIWEVPVDELVKPEVGERYSITTGKSIFLEFRIEGKNRNSGHLIKGTALPYVEKPCDMVLYAGSKGGSVELKMNEEIWQNLQDAFPEYFNFEKERDAKIEEYYRQLLND